MSIDYCFKRLGEEIATAAAAHAAELAQLRESVKLGKMTSVFKPVVAGSVTVRLLEAGRYDLSKKIRVSFGVTSQKEYPLNEENAIAAKAFIATTFAGSKQTHEENLAICAENDRIAKELINLVETCGLNTSVMEWNSRKRTDVKTNISSNEHIMSRRPVYEHRHLDLDKRQAELFDFIDLWLKMEKDNAALLAAKAKAEKLAKPLVPEAIVYLTQHGRVMGADFSPETAVDLANAVAYEEAIAAKIAEDPSVDGSEFERYGSFSFKNPDIYVIPTSDEE